MKSNGITTVLNVVLAVSLLAAMILCAQFIVQSRAYRADNAKAVGINEWHGLLRAFAADCVTYSRTNSDIIPILETVGWVGNRPAAPATPAKK